MSTLFDILTRILKKRQGFRKSNIWSGKVCVRKLRSDLSICWVHSYKMFVVFSSASQHMRGHWKRNCTNALH